MLIKHLYRKLPKLLSFPKFDCGPGTVEGAISWSMFPEFRAMTPYMQKRLLNLCVGLEIEAENLAGLKYGVVDSHYWVIEKDGSLRDNGLEFVTSLGIRAGYIPRALGNLMEAFEKTRKAAEQPVRRKAMIDDDGREWVEEFDGEPAALIPSYTERTSVHIHVDCRMLSTDQVKAMLVLYTLFERSIFKMSCDERRHNIFTVPVGNSDKLLLAAPEERTLAELSESWGRYSALNLNALAKYGTVEFRHLSGTHDPNVILPWMAVLSCLRIAAGMTTCAEVVGQIRAAQRSGSFKELFMQTFGAWAGRLQFDNPAFESAAADAKTLSLIGA